MSEEKAVYSTAEEKMREILKSVKTAFIDGRCIHAGSIEDLINIQIDEALTMKAPDIDELKIRNQAFNEGYKQRETEYGLKAKYVQELISGAYKEGRADKDNEVAVQLLELPDAIKSQSSGIADLTARIETLRLSIENSKNQALELVLSATITENGKTKEKYSNDKARNLAVQQLLREDKLYLDSIDELGRKESELRREQIQLDCLHNQFRAYLAIAGMNGVIS